MAIDFELLRELALRAESDAPFEIMPNLPFVDMNMKDEGGGHISISIPKTEGAEFSHWRLLFDLDFVRVRHDGRSGFGFANNRVEALTAKGEEFIELSRDAKAFKEVLTKCRAAQACTIENIVRELRKAARKRLENGKAD